MAGLIVGHPVDTCKVRLQIDPHSLIDTVKYVHQRGGVFGNFLLKMFHKTFNKVITCPAFFRGMGAPLLSNGIMNSLYFGFYGGSLDRILKWKESHLPKSQQSNVLIIVEFSI